MATILNKKVEDLEATYWAKAEPMTLPTTRAAMDFADSIEPLAEKAFNVWEDADAEAPKAIRRLQQMEKAMPPIHPAFLPDYSDAIRRSHWAAYHSADYRELMEKHFARFLEYVRARYDVKDGGLLGVALRLYEKDLDKWTTHNEYIGRQVSREDMAGDMIELQRIFWRKRLEADNPEDQQPRDALWQETQFETEFNIYGRRMSDADMELDDKMWAQLDKDMAAGKPSNESEAAAYFRDISARYPHR